MGEIYTFSEECQGENGVSFPWGSKRLPIPAFSGIGDLHQLLRVGLEEGLVHQVGLSEPDGPRPDEAGGHAQGDFPGPVLGEAIQEERLFFVGKSLGEVAQRVHQDVDVGRQAGRTRQRFLQMAFVLGHHVGDGFLVEVGHDAPEGLQFLLMGGHQEKFIPGVKPNEVFHGAGRPDLPKGGQGEEPGQEMLPDAEVRQPALVLDGKMGKHGQDLPAEEPGFLPERVSLFRVDLDVLDAAGGRTVFQDEPVDDGQCAQEFPGKRAHGLGDVLFGGRLDEPERFARGRHADGMAGDAQAEFDFRADGLEVDVGIQVVDDVGSNRQSVVPAGGKPQTLADDEDGFGKFLHAISGRLIPALPLLKSAFLLRNLF